tara:strand:- start:672 stop:1523 length:852 start_codon:yes stop_codon:yes gene_type:complete
MFILNKKSLSLVNRKISQINGQLIKGLQNNKGSIVLINSFPKSGTHLLYQLFENMLNIKSYHTFIASMPSFTQIERTKKKTLQMINAMVDGELARAHLFYDPAFEKSLAIKNLVHFFIYRDPRDIVISEANYFYDMNPFNRYHYYFKKYPKLSDRIMFSIKGNAYHKTAIHYPNIALRFNKYKSWMSTNSVYCVKYENLVGKNKYNEIKKIMLHYLEHSNENVSIDDLVKNAISNIDPKKSHTFREGGTQKWKQYFNQEHKKVFKKISGELLIDLEYETDMNW